MFYYEGTTQKNKKAPLEKFSARSEKVSKSGGDQRKILVKLAEDEFKKLKTPPKSTPISPTEDHPCNGALLGFMTEQYRMIDGFHDVFGVVFDSLNLSSHFTKLRYDQLRNVTIARIADPSSKLRTSQILTKNFLKPLSENQIYRLMDDLMDHEEQIKRAIFETTKNLTPKQSVSILEDETSGKFYQLPSKMNKKANLIYRAMGAKRSHRPSEFKMSKNVVEQKKFK